MTSTNNPDSPSPCTDPTVPGPSDGGELAVTPEALRDAHVRAEQRWPSHRLGPYPVDPNGGHQ